MIELLPSLASLVRPDLASLRPAATWVGSCRPPLRAPRPEATDVSWPERMRFDGGDGARFACSADGSEVDVRRGQESPSEPTNNRQPVNSRGLRPHPLGGAGSSDIHKERQRKHSAP